MTKSATKNKIITGGRNTVLSKDGKWRSFPRVPNLLQYVSSETYFARVKVKGKIIRESLETTVWSTAKLRLLDFLKRQQQGEAQEILTPLFPEAVTVFTTALERDVKMKASSKHYRLTCLRKIELTWPDLWQLRLNQVTEEACLQWGENLRASIANQYFNNVVSTLRMILKVGIKFHEKRGGKTLENPAAALSKLRVKQKELKLPESDQFKKLVHEIRVSGAWGQGAGDLVEFLAYSGLRIYTEANLVTWADVDWERREIVVRGDSETHTKNWEVRRVPIISNMEKLLSDMKARLGGNPTGKLLEVSECPISLRNACIKIGIPKLTHHDLRHLFATKCIESGVDNPTLAKWLGHKDGGALAMKTYGHLRNEHSLAMAQKVTF